MVSANTGGGIAGMFGGMPTGNMNGMDMNAMMRMAMAGSGMEGRFPGDAAAP